MDEGQRVQVLGDGGRQRRGARRQGEDRVKKDPLPSLVSSSLWEIPAPSIFLAVECVVLMGKEDHDIPHLSWKKK